MKPQLAKVYKTAWVDLPVYIQPKLDGCRAIWTGKELLTRTGKPILGVPALVEELSSSYKDFPLDGELYNHEKTFQEQISSVRRTVNIQEDLSIQYHIYDLPIEDLVFEERLVILKSSVKQTNRIKIVPTFKVSSLEQIQNKFESEGYEGTMVRNASGLYKFGKRSSDLMKLKSFLDDEFKIVDVYQLSRKEKLIVSANTPGAHQYADGTWYKDGEETPVDMAGGLVLELPDGRRFESGTGYDEETRKAFWKNPPIGKMATIKYQELTDDGIPRFPVFVRLRDNKDY